MSKNVLNEIVDDLDLKPNKTKLLLKWVIGISSSLIVGAFVFGQLKMSNLNRLDNIEKNLEVQSKEIKEFRQEHKQGQEQLNLRIDKVYDDASASFESFQESNQKQLELIIDYGGDSQEVLKEMLKINAMERQQSIEKQLEKAKNETPYVGDVEITPVEERKAKNCESVMVITPQGTQDTLFIANGANQKYLNNINKEIYTIESIDSNAKNPKLFDVRYRRK